MGAIFSSSVESFHFSRDIVVCIIIQLEKINSLKAYHVVYTGDGEIRGFFFKYRFQMKLIFKMCRAHLMTQSIYKQQIWKIKYKIDDIHFRSRFNGNVGMYIYCEPKRVCCDACQMVLIHDVGLCIWFNKFGPNKEPYIAKIDDFKSNVARLCEFTDDEKTHVRDYWIQTFELEKIFFL